MTWMVAAACTDAADSDPSESIAQTAQALVDPARVMGVESTGDWSISSGSLSSSSVQIDVFEDVRLVN